MTKNRGKKKNQTNKRPLRNRSTKSKTLSAKPLRPRSKIEAAGRKTENFRTTDGRIVKKKKIHTRLVVKKKKKPRMFNAFSVGDSLRDLKIIITTRTIDNNNYITFPSRFFFWFFYDFPYRVIISRFRRNGRRK